MKFLSMHHASLFFDDNTIFDNIDISISLGSRVGLVGYNGCGKSTLLKVLNGLIPLAEGHVSSSNHSVIARVEQNLKHEMLKCSAREAIAMMLSKEDRAYNFWKVDVLLDEIGFHYDILDRQIKELSEGEYNRILLARALIQEPDFLLLDEPSNHMDLPNLLWLESFLSQWKGGFILVSHDQNILNNTTDTTLFLRDKKLYKISAPYTAALELLEKQDNERVSQRAKEDRKIERITKSSKKIAEWGRVYDNSKLAKKAKSMQKTVEKLKENRVSVSYDKGDEIEIVGEKLHAKRLIVIPPLTIKDVSGERELYRIKDEIVIKAGDKISLIGANGAGKSTFARYIDDNYKKEESALRYHERLALGHYEQADSKFNSSMGIFESLEMHLKVVDSDTIKKALIRYGFPYKVHNKATNLLSAGQRARLNMIFLSLQRLNFIIFDEPTNHLDLFGRERLIETLNNFEGALLVISHDRHFLEKICNRFFYISSEVIAEEIDLQKSYHRLLG